MHLFYRDGIRLPCVTAGIQAASLLLRQQVNGYTSEMGQVPFLFALMTQKFYSQDLKQPVDRVLEAFQSSKSVTMTAGVHLIHSEIQPFAASDTTFSISYGQRTFNKDQAHRNQIRWQTNVFFFYSVL